MGCGVVGTVGGPPFVGTGVITGGAFVGTGVIKTGAGPGAGPGPGGGAPLSSVESVVESVASVASFKIEPLLIATEAAVVEVVLLLVVALVPEVLKKGVLLLELRPRTAIKTKTHTANSLPPKNLLRGVTADPSPPQNLLVHELFEFLSFSPAAPGGESKRDDS